MSRWRNLSVEVQPNKNKVMKKLYAFLFLSFFVFSHYSCQKDGKNCIKVRYITGYCPYPDGSLVEVLEPNDDATASTNNGYTTYTMALFYLPKEFKVRDKVFFVKYYHDANLPKPEVRPCLFDTGTANMFGAKSASLTRCDN